jgi:hypothetical protein
MGKGMHTSYPKGTPLFIKLKTGEVITGKFADHKSGKVLLENGTSVNLADVRAMSIRKLTPSLKPKSTKKIKFRIDKQ